MTFDDLLRIRAECNFIDKLVEENYQRNLRITTLDRQTIKIRLNSIREIVNKESEEKLVR